MSGAKAIDRQIIKCLLNTRKRIFFPQQTPQFPLGLDCRHMAWVFCNVKDIKLSLIIQCWHPFFFSDCSPYQSKSQSCLCLLQIHKTVYNTLLIFCSFSSFLLYSNKQLLLGFAFLFLYPLFLFLFFNFLSEPFCLDDSFHPSSVFWAELRHLQWCQLLLSREFPDGVFTVKGPGSIPDQETKIPQALWHAPSQKKCSSAANWSLIFFS